MNNESLCNMTDLTLILNEIESGRAGTQQLMAVVYDELRRIASEHMKQERPGHSLQPTALVHEAFLRLVGDGNVTWQNRRHFFGAAAIAMQRILVDNARQRRQLQRGGQHHKVDLIEADIAVEDHGLKVDLIALESALSEFQAEDAPKAELVRLRYFAGLSEEEAALTLGISRPTASRWWAYSRAWLLCRMQGNSEAS